MLLKHARPVAPGGSWSCAGSMGEPATVIFRAIFRNENRNQVLHTGEAVAIEIEVKNEGPGTARAVEISVTTTPPLIERIPSLVSVGDLQPGEVKRLTLDGKVAW
jgi:hypothetical protein